MSEKGNTRYIYIYMYSHIDIYSSLSGGSSGSTASIPVLARSSSHADRNHRINPKRETRHRESSKRPNTHEAPSNNGLRVARRLHGIHQVIVDEERTPT